MYVYVYTHTHTYLYLFQKQKIYIKYIKFSIVIDTMHMPICTLTMS